MNLGVWAELLDDAAIEAALPELAGAGARLGLAVASERIGDPALAELTRRAADRGVSVRIWLLLPKSGGYWIGETNAEAFAERLGELVRWRDRSGGPVFEGVSFDLEPDFAYSEALRTEKKSRPDRWLSLLASHVEPVRFGRARDTLARAADRLRQAGLRSHAVSYPLILDQPAGDCLLEDALDVPVSGIDWDEVSVMVYQTAFAQQLGLWLGPALVHSYAIDAVRRFGDRAGIDVGVVGDAGLGLEPGDRYPSPAELRADIEAALAAGIPPERIRVYGLAGVLGAGGVGRWLRLPELTPRTPVESREVAGVRNGARALVPAIRQLL
jgi:hypothetical protein